MANIKFEIDGKVYDFAPESFVIDNEGNIILKSKQEKRNPFERVKEGDGFYVLGQYGDIQKAREGFMCSGSALYEAANYCTDEELLRRRALYEKLERCLWRFSMENGGSGDFCLVMNRVTGRWTPFIAQDILFGPSFKTYETCQRAIEEVIKPILDGVVEEEIFEWRGV